MESLADRMLAVLEANRVGRWTKPAPKLYPHQWNWDSAFIAIGLSHHDPKRARDELLSLRRGQWSDGMIPHILFHPEHVEYGFGPEFWATSGLKRSPEDVQTSGLTQPPVLAYAVWEVFQRSEDDEAGLEFLRRMFPSLMAYHEYFAVHRVIGDDGLAVIYHPWESGLDNSPRWDEPLEAFELTWAPKYDRVDLSLIDVKERPSKAHYDRYVYLVEWFRKHDYEEAALKEACPFRVKPLLFNCLLALSLEALERIASTLGEEVTKVKAWRERVEHGVRDVLWSEEHGCYIDYDVVGERPVVTDTIAQFAPMICGLASEEFASAAVDRLASPDYWPEDGFPFATTATTGPAYSSKGYWRGPIWVNVNWLLFKALQRYRQYDIAYQARKRTLELVERGGAREYFEPETGDGLGTDQFSWTAALVLDLIKAAPSGAETSPPEVAE